VYVAPAVADAGRKNPGVATIFSLAHIVREVNPLTVREASAPDIEDSEQLKVPGFVGMKRNGSEDIPLPGIWRVNGLESFTNVSRPPVWVHDTDSVSTAVVAELSTRMAAFVTFA
jgi:hypothetical protein